MFYRTTATRNLVLCLAAAGLFAYGCSGSQASHDDVHGADAGTKDAGKTDAGRNDAAPGDADAAEPDADDPPPLGPAAVELCSKRDSKDVLCSVIPNDLFFKGSHPAYFSLNAVDQRPFDNFSWQVFIGLNWPANRDGSPKETSIVNDATSPRVWETYETLRDVFGEDTKLSSCDGIGDAADAILDVNYLQATQMPIIDRNLNFAVYDVRMNGTETKYIRDNGLETKLGQEKFFATNNPRVDAGKEIDFPVGTYDDIEARTGGHVGSIEVKATWRILTDKDDASRYYTVNRRILIPAKDSAAGKDTCVSAKLGMVAFHIMDRIQIDGQPQDWMWPSFEHVDNAPIAANAVDQTEEELDGACMPPANAPDTFSFFNPSCTGADCRPNRRPLGNSFLWASAQPFAAAYANTVDGKSYGSQLVRCWAPFPETVEVDRAYQKALAGSPFANYRLVNTQWDAHPDNPMEMEPKAIPRKMSNVVAESYNQDSSCIDCHRRAKTAVPGKTGNFSFLLGHAK